MKSFQITEIFSVPSETIYKAWLNSKEHSNMTSGEAKCSNKVGDIFTAWDGYISGTNCSLIPNKEIKQSWRTSEFKESGEDSELIIRLVDNKEGCELTLIHSNIPEGQSDYKQGWMNHYFSPMKEYFKK